MHIMFVTVILTVALNIYMGYSRDFLLSVKDTLPDVPALPQSVVSELRYYGINAVPQTTRGTRAGKHHLRPISVVPSYRRDDAPKYGEINSANLIHLTQEASTIPVHTTARPDDISARLNSRDHSAPNHNLVQIKQERNSYTTVREKISVGYLNARSVKNKSAEVADFVVDNELDICAITETWLGKEGGDELVCRELTPAGYSLEHVARSKGKGGGVAVIFKDSFATKTEKVSAYKSFELIELTLRTQKDCIRLGVVYRPPSGGKSGQPVSVFQKEFQDYINSHASSVGKLLVVGDFNLHMDRLSSHEAAQFKEVLFSLNLQQHVTTATHDHGHMLDLVITRDGESLVEDITIHPAVMSDHNPLSFCVKIKKPEKQRRTITYRKICDIDKEKFAQDIQGSDLITDPAEELDDLVNQYNSSLSSILDKHAPVRTKQVMLRHNTPWYTEDIQEVKKRRRKAERRWRSSGLAIDLDILRTERIRMNKICADAKAKYYKDKITECAKDQKSLFKFADQLLCKQKDISLPTHQNA